MKINSQLVAFLINVWAKTIKQVISFVLLNAFAYFQNR
jgi:hypothetical protein